MKKFLIVALALLAIFSTSLVALGLNSPSVSKGAGVITGMFATEDIGILLGLEYGLSEKFAVSGRVGLDDDFEYTKFVVKYGVSPTFALLGGVIEYGYDETDPYFGINGAVSFDRDFMGILEAGVVLTDDDPEVIYEVGIKYKLNNQLDIRGGIMGSTHDGSDTAFELGAGFSF
ncbi:MAG: porin family protein [Firmicutes bacterium]|nr:porin family protein [Bacillota bacterium]